MPSVTFVFGKKLPFCASAPTRPDTSPWKSVAAHGTSAWKPTHSIDCVDCPVLLTGVLPGSHPHPQSKTPRAAATACDNFMVEPPKRAEPNPKFASVSQILFDQRGRR